MKFALLLGLALPCMGQIGMAFPGPGTVHSTGGGGSFTLVQAVGAVADGSGGVLCVVAVCTLTIPSTGTGHALMLLLSEANATSNFMTAVTGAGTWTVAAAAQLNNGCCAATSGAYNLASTSGVTTLSVTLSAAAGTLTQFVYWEIAGPTALDSGATPINAVHNTVSGTAQTGAPLTVSGATLAVAQMCGNSSSSMSSAATPYDTNFIKKDTTSNFPFQFGGGSIALNITSGAGAAFTSSGSGTSVCNSIALK